MALGPMRVIVLREYLIGLEHLVGMRVRGVCGILATQIAMLGLSTSITELPTRLGAVEAMDLTTIGVLGEKICHAIVARLRIR